MPALERVRKQCSASRRVPSVRCINRDANDGRPARTPGNLPRSNDCRLPAMLVRPVGLWPMCRCIPRHTCQFSKTVYNNSHCLHIQVVMHVGPYSPSNTDLEAHSRRHLGKRDAADARGNRAYFGLQVAECRRGALAPCSARRHRSHPRRFTRQPTQKDILREQLGLPLIGRVAAGRPILAEEHIETRYQITTTQLFQPQPHYLLESAGHEYEKCRHPGRRSGCRASHA